MHEIKIKYEDLKKVIDFLEKNCKGSVVNISIEYPKLIIKTSTVNMQKISVTLLDDQYYRTPYISKEESL